MDLCLPYLLALRGQFYLLALVVLYSKVPLVLPHQFYLLALVVLLGLCNKGLLALLVLCSKAPLVQLVPCLLYLLALLVLRVQFYLLDLLTPFL